MSVRSRRSGETPREPVRSAMADGLALLTGRALTEAELAERLHRRGHPPEIIEETLARLGQLGCIDDRSVAIAWADSAARNRGLGPGRVSVGLRRRHIAEETVAEATASAFPPGAEERLAEEALARWVRSHGLLEGEVRVRAVYAHLLRRGFSASAARGVLFKARGNG